MSQFWLDDDDINNGSQAGGGLMAIESLSSSQQQPPSQSQQQALLACCCTNCGSTDFYYDAVAGRDVCQNCFTQSQLLTTQQEAAGEGGSQQQLEYEDIMELAAKTRGGTLITSTAATRKRKRTATTSGQQQQQQQQQTTKQPLEELDQSVPLPDLETCLEAFTRVLKVCTRLLARRVGHQRLETTTSSSTAQPQRQQQLETSLLRTVQHLWVAYLCAFADGAEYYGRLCPEMRLSLRDAFCAYSGQHRNMILSHLAYRAEQEIRQRRRQEKEEASDNSSSSSSTRSSKKKKKKNPSEEATGAAVTETNNQDDSATAALATSTAPTTITGTSAAAATTTTTVTTTNAHQKRTKKPSTNTKKKKTTKRKKKTSSSSSKQSGAPTNWNRVINASTRNRREGYKEAALKIKPSMEFICVLLWLAVCESGLVSSSDLVQWIADGYFPLWNAMSVLPATLQSKLRPIRTFFRLSAIPSPHYLETNGMILAVACRMKAHEASQVHPSQNNITTTATDAHTTQPNSHRVKQVTTSSTTTTTKRNEELVFWSAVCLPMVVARLVANAGLDQEVLNRTLALMNLPVPTTTKAQHATNEQGRLIPKPLLIAQKSSATTTAFTRNEDILAVIGIACMMDSTWRSRPYRRGAKVPSSVPYNEVHFAMLDSASLKEYLDFAEANVFDDKSKSWVWDGFDDLLYETKQQQSKTDCYDDSYGNEDGHDSDSSSSSLSSLVVKPCPVIAGQTLLSESSSLYSNRARSKQEVAAKEWNGNSDVTDDVRRSMLIDFLAYSANAKVSRVREKMNIFLSSLRK